MNSAGSLFFLSRGSGRSRRLCASLLLFPTCPLTAAILQPLEPSLQGWGLPRDGGRRCQAPSAGSGLHGAASRSGAAGLAWCSWSLLSPSSGFLLLTHLHVRGECASAQSLQAAGLNIICLWFSGPDTHPATEGWLGEGGLCETGVACRGHRVPQPCFARRKLRSQGWQLRVASCSCASPARPRREPEAG